MEFVPKCFVLGHQTGAQTDKCACCISGGEGNKCHIAAEAVAASALLQSSLQFAATSISHCKGNFGDVLSCGNGRLSLDSCLSCQDRAISILLYSCVATRSLAATTQGTVVLIVTARPTFCNSASVKSGG
jgi:hypothetical protein